MSFLEIYRCRFFCGIAETPRWDSVSYMEVDYSVLWIHKCLRMPKDAEANVFGALTTLITQTFERLM